MPARRLPEGLPAVICEECSAVGAGHWTAELWRYCRHSACLASRDSSTSQWRVEGAVSLADATERFERLARRLRALRLGVRLDARGLDRIRRHLQRDGAG